ncbi:glutaredoxin domain-containing protein [Corynebacterium glutamicum]|uniref:glutaredoxin domain-containing protein n=1 Tax=Corynebacterium glutamicum TaxID=1718 RepID=UPI0022A8B2EB|nr:glutaredoxin domain-containing protein [Corynebacterium glutamicum]
MYSRPGCMKCRATCKALTKMGVEVMSPQIDEHPEKVELMRSEGWLELPLVEVSTPDGVVRWAGMATENLNALKYLVSERS